MKLIDVQSMQVIDKSYGDQGLPELVPMEHAAKAVADVAATILGDGKKVVVICGKGNNGGDGFGAARWLSAQGKKVEVFGVGSSSNEAMTEYNLLVDSGAVVTDLRTQADLDYLKMAASKADLVIDALLGTGFEGELKESYALLTDIMNGVSCPVLSVDIPSGVNGNTGAVAEHAVQADYTLTLARPKVGMLLYPAREYLGELMLADIGIPPRVMALDSSKFYLVDREMVRDLLPVRSADAHKGDCGKVTILAGSTGYTGAAGLASKAAVKSGAGLVTLFTHASAANVLAAKLDEEMVRPLAEVEEGGLKLEGVETIVNFESDVLAMGPGLGRTAATHSFVRDLISQAKVPMVIDADALNAVAGHLDVLTMNDVPKVLTPHAGEFSRLTGVDVEEINSNRLALAEKYAKRWNVVLVLKGAPTLVAMPSGSVYLVDSGSSSMATGGSGDVLTGIIAGLMAQGLDAEGAAIAGCYLHGLAGTMATNGVPGLAAGEIAENFPGAYESICEAETEDGIVNSGIRVVE